MRAFPLLVVLAVLACSAPANAATTVVTYSQVGGLAGSSISLSIHSDRLAFVRGHGHHAIKAATLARVRSLLKAAHLERRLTPSAGTCADCFEYTIDDGHRSRTLEQDAIPSRYRKLLTELQRIAAGGR